METKYRTLESFPLNCEGVIFSIHSGRGLLNRLFSMGIYQGKKLRRLGENLRNGPVCIEINNSRYILGRGIAQKIIIKYETNSNEE